VTKIAGSGSGSESGPISQRHGSADPDPHQNATLLFMLTMFIVPVDIDLLNFWANLTVDKRFMKSTVVTVGRFLRYGTHF
jgi:hypothetical protein